MINAFILATFRLQVEAGVEAEEEWSCLLAGAAGLVVAAALAAGDQAPFLVAVRGLICHAACMQIVLCHGQSGAVQDAVHELTCPLQQVRHEVG